MAVLVAAASKHGATEELAALREWLDRVIPQSRTTRTPCGPALPNNSWRGRQRVSTSSSPGGLNTSQLGLMERIAVRGAHAREGDHRDWQAIDEWAAAIATDVKASSGTH